MEITSKAIIDYIQPIGVVSLVGVCIYLVRMTNGNINNKVSRHECHSAQEGIKKQITEIDKNMDRRFEDLKDFILKNGYK